METVRSARARYFADNGFAPDGGYDDKWVDLKLGPLPFRLKNTSGRASAVPYHDLHHVATGYATDLVGEFEISAFEVGAGCRNYYAAWAINLAGMAGGLFRTPRRTFRAFVRGRRARSVYGRELEPLLDGTVDDLRQEMKLPPEPPRARATDAALFGGAVAAGLTIGLFMLPFGLVMGPIGAIAAATTKARPAPQ